LKGSGTWFFSSSLDREAWDCLFDIFKGSAGFSSKLSWLRYGDDEKGLDIFEGAEGAALLGPSSKIVDSFFCSEGSYAGRVSAGGG